MREKSGSRSNYLPGRRSGDGERGSIARGCYMPKNELTTSERTEKRTAMNLGQIILTPLICLLFVPAALFCAFYRLLSDVVLAVFRILSGFFIGFKKGWMWAWGLLRDLWADTKAVEDLIEGEQLND